MIADERVASVYEHCLGRLGVIKSYPKSNISHSGCAEFAKRFRVRDLKVDFSQIEVRCLMSYHHPFGLMAIVDKYPISRWTTV